MLCADLGCSTGGFTDCLLRRGASRVYSVDTAYGELAWKLRQDDRVVVLERTNAIYFNPLESLSPDVDQARAKKHRKSRRMMPDDFAGVDLVVIDLGWTKQDKALLAARRWLNRQGAGHVITLIKPHYESGKHQLDDEEAMNVAMQVLQAIQTQGWLVHGHVASPIPGGKGGNLEVLAHLQAEHLQHAPGDLS